MLARRSLQGWPGQILAAVAASGLLALLLTISLAHRAGGAAPATATAGATAPPTATATRAPASPPAAAAGGGSAQLTFSGAISGPMQVTSVSCEAHVPEGDGGFMGVIGTVAGRVHMVQLWSHGPSPGTLLYIQVWNGTPATGSDIAYQNASGMSGPFAGARGFDWTAGVTLDAALSDFRAAQLPGIHPSGRITCPAPTPTPAPQTRPEPVLSGPTHVDLSGAISGSLENAEVSCAVHIRDADGGAMSVSGTVAGRAVQLWIWSRGPSPGTLGDMYEGPQAGVIDYGQIGAGGSPPDSPASPGSTGSGGRRRPHRGPGASPRAVTGAPSGRPGRDHTVSATGS